MAPENKGDGDSEITVAATAGQAGERVVQQCSAGGGDGRERSTWGKAHPQA